MSLKMAVHNITEVKALIKEAYARGDEQTYDGVRWYDHDGKFLLLSSINLTEFVLHLDTKESITVEVL